MVVCLLSFPNVFSLVKVGQVFEFTWQKALAWTLNRGVCLSSISELHLTYVLFVLMFLMFFISREISEWNGNGLSLLLSWRGTSRTSLIPWTINPSMEIISLTTRMILLMLVLLSKLLAWGKLWRSTSSTRRNVPVWRFDEEICDELQHHREGNCGEEKCQKRLEETSWSKERQGSSSSLESFPFTRDPGQGCWAYKQ